jgi:hypothetical protein
MGKPRVWTSGRMRRESGYRNDEYALLVDRSHPVKRDHVNVDICSEKSMAAFYSETNCIARLNQSFMTAGFYVINGYK